MVMAVVAMMDTAVSSGGSGGDGYGSGGNNGYGSNGSGSGSASDGSSSGGSDDGYCSGWWIKQWQQIVDCMMGNMVGHKSMELLMLGPYTYSYF